MVERLAGRRGSRQHLRKLSVVDELGADCRGRQRLRKLPVDEVVAEVDGG